jgi:predicted  nucleic acid-binding Zn ribbon protein
MFDNELLKIKKKIRGKNYVMTIHAEEEMSDDNLSIFDVEHGILTGKILERQTDRLTLEYKYRIRGQSLDADEIEIIVKFSPTEKVVIITVYLFST